MEYLLETKKDKKIKKNKNNFEQNVMIIHMINCREIFATVLENIICFCIK